MLFNSVNFVIFFLLTTVVFFSIPFRYQWALLLSASCYFYMVFVPYYIFILGFTIVIDYFAGILIEKAKGREKHWLLVSSLIANIGILFVFKYFNFFNSNITELARFLHWNYPIKNLEIILPIGLSFHTFQAMSYTIEVYRGRQKAERHFGIYALYVMFYPQLVAGPIERPQNLLHQFHATHSFHYPRIVSGLRLMLWGFFKKIVIADTLAVFVNKIYENPTGYRGLPLLVAVYFFTFQIFCDFSGYSDIARGAARVLGFELMINFRSPYFSGSIREFWRRWHISLSTWFRDYLYIPLGGNKTETLWRAMANLWIVFLLSGLWHGANWTFLIWGMLHGGYLVVDSLTSRLRTRLLLFSGALNHPRTLRVLGTILTFHLVALAWVFFRANSVADALYVITHIFSNLAFDLTHTEQMKQVTRLVLTKYEMILCLASIGLMEFVHWLQLRQSPQAFFARQPWPLRWGVYYGALLALLFFAEASSQQFIYFQF